MWPDGRSARNPHRPVSIFQSLLDPVSEPNPTSAIRYHRLIKRVEIKDCRAACVFGRSGQVLKQIGCRVGVLRQAALTDGTAGKLFFVNESPCLRRLASARSTEQDQTPKARKLKSCALLCLADSCLHQPTSIDLPHASRHRSSTWAHRPPAGRSHASVVTDVRASCAVGADCSRAAVGFPRGRRLPWGVAVAVSAFAGRGGAGHDSCATLDVLSNQRRPGNAAGHRLHAADSSICFLISTLLLRELSRNQVSKKTLGRLQDPQRGPPLPLRGRAVRAGRGGCAHARLVERQAPSPPQGLRLGRWQGAINVGYGRRCWTSISS